MKSVRPQATNAHNSIGGRFRYGELAAIALLLSTFGTYRRRPIWELFTSNGLDFEVKAKLCIWGLFGVFAVLAHQRINKRTGLLVRVPVSLYVAYCALAFLSVTHSISPGFSCYRAAQIALLIALALAYANRTVFWPQLAILFIGMNWVFLVIGLTGIVPSLDWRLLPTFQEAGFNSFSQPWRFGTPVGHFSQISIVAAMAAIAISARSRRLTSKDLVLFGWMLITIALTKSRTAMMGLVGGLVVVAVLRGKLVPSVLSLAIIGPLVLATPEVGNALTAFLDRGQTQAQLDSLTGRTSIWDSALKHIHERWLQGYGYRADRFIVLDEQVNGSGVSHAHNAVLESAAGLGVGGALLAIAILSSLLLYPLRIAVLERRNVYPPESRRAVEFAAMFPPVFAFSMLDSSFALDASPFILVFIAMLVDMTMHGEELQSQAPQVVFSLPDQSAASIGDGGGHDGIVR